MKAPDQRIRGLSIPVCDSKLIHLFSITVRPGLFCLRGAANIGCEPAFEPAWTLWKARPQAALPAPQEPTPHGFSHTLFNPAPPVARLSPDFCLLSSGLLTLDVIDRRTPAA